MRDVERLFQNFQYGEAGRQIYDFFWSEFADWYVEIAKLQLEAGAELAHSTMRHLVQILDTCLRLLHPFTPFVTEEIWGHLRRAAIAMNPPIPPNPTFLGASLQGRPELAWEEALIIARWPEPVVEDGWEAKAISDFALIMEIVRAIRNLRAEKNVKPGQRIPATLVGGAQADILRQQAGTIAALARLDPDRMTIQETLAEKPQGQVTLVVGGVEISLPLASLLDVAEERRRLEKELKDAQAQIERLEALLAGPFAEKAPPALVQKEREKLSGFTEKAQKVHKQLVDLGESGTR